MQAVAVTTGQRTTTIDMEASARDNADGGVDLARTFGPMDVRYPVLLELPLGVGPGEALAAIKEQMRTVPDGGVGYGLLRYLSDDPSTKSQYSAFAQPSVR